MTCDKIILNQYKHISETILTSVNMAVKQSINEDDLADKLFLISNEFIIFLNLVDQKYRQEKTNKKSINYRNSLFDYINELQALVAKLDDCSIELPLALNNVDNIVSNLLCNSKNLLIA